MLIEIMNLSTGEKEQIRLHENAEMGDAVRFAKMAFRDGVKVTIYRKTFNSWLPWEAERVFQ